MLERIFTFGARRRIPCVLLLVLLTAIAVNGLMKLRIDANYDSFMSANDPNYPAYERTIEEFGSDNTTIIYLRDPELFSQARLRRIEELASALSDLDAVERVESLFSALNIRDQEGMLEVGPLMDTTPEDPEALALARSNALYSPLMKRNVISEDGQVTSITVTAKRDRKDPDFNKKFFRAVEDLLAPLRGEFDEVFQIGPPRLNVEIERAMFADIFRLTPMATALLMITIFCFLGTGMAAVLPLFTAGLSIIWTLGVMGYVGLPLTLLTALLPTLLIVIGSAEDTHMLSEYLHAIASGNPSHAGRQQAVRLMAKKIALPIVLNTFTTVLGFYANAVNDIILIKGFAYSSSFAMTASFVSTVLFLPLAVSFFSPKRIHLAPENEKPHGLVGKLVDALEHVSTRYRKTLVGLLAGVVVVFLGLALRVQVTNDPLSYFKPNTVLIKDSNTLQKDLAGMSVFFLTLEAKEAGAFKRPELLRSLDTIDRRLDELGFDKALSLADFLALVNREMHQGDPAFHRVPDRQDLVEQYLLFFQREDLEQYVDHDYRVANMIVRHHFSDSHTLNQQLAVLQRELPAILGERVSFRLTGENLMINQAAESLFIGEVQSVGMLISVIFVIMSLLYTSALAGVVSLVPNLIPIVINFGTMALLKIPLNPGTAMVAAIAIGIAVDDTTHLMSRYNDERKKTADMDEALRVTVWGEAVPVMATTVSLALGFVILMSSKFTIVAQFGLLSAIIMIVGLLTDMLITPLLLKHVRLVGIWDILALKVGREVVSRSPLFEGMSKFQIKKAILLSRLVTVPQSQDVLVQGTRGRNMYVVLSGAVDVLRTQEARTERIATLRPGEIFGEVGYSQETERTATVRAAAEVTLLELEFSSVQKALRWYPQIAAHLNLNISRILGTRLAGMHARTAHLGLADAKA
ncbi:MAG: MMPL family transporter [Candidatus Omnitrophica bacterium]|nr:MMPL family transporter [Candidatus Omnitrophota bacterium]